MSNHDDMNPFDQMDEDDFFDEIDYQNHGGDAALDEYEMVFPILFLGLHFYF